MNMRVLGVCAAVVAGMVAGAGAGVVSADPDGGGSVAAALHGLAEFERGATSAEADAVLDALGDSPIVSLGSIGDSVEGRPIRVGVVADPPVAFDVDGPEKGEIGDRLVVLLFGSIHAGELCGTDALLRLMHDIIGDRRDGRDMRPLLEDLVICVVPVYNVDGHAKFAASNRPGQNGPAAVGERANAQGLDLNRDWVKMDAPETRAMVGFLNAWDPAVIVDTHTTNGSNHRFTLTYQGPKHPAGDAEVIAYVRDEMLPKVDAAFEAATGYESYFYGNFAEHHTKWTTYPAEPWYGAAYRGIRNRLTVLTEAYAYASFEDRVLSTQAFCEQVLRYAAAQKDEIRALVDAADARTIAAGKSGAPIAVKTEARAFAEPATILGYDEPVESGAHSARAKIDFETAEKKDYEIPIFNDFVATEVVRRAEVYAVLPWAMEVVDRLIAHGIEVWYLQELTAVPGGDCYLVDAKTVSEREWEGRRRVELEVQSVPAGGTFREGTVFVRTDQPLGSLAAYLLEPRATGGLASWDVFGDTLRRGQIHPAMRYSLEEIQALSLERTSPEDSRTPTSEIRPEAPE